MAGGRWKVAGGRWQSVGGMGPNCLGAYQPQAGSDGGVGVRVGAVGSVLSTFYVVIVVTSDDRY